MMFLTKIIDLFNADDFLESLNDIILTNGQYLYSSLTNEIYFMLNLIINFR